MKHKIKTKLSFGSERGVSALEFTLIAPLLFVLIFGMIEFSIFFYDKAMITNAAREGARAGIIAKSPRMTEGEIEQVVLKYAQKHLITFGDDILSVEDITIEPSSLEGAKFGDDLKVTVNYQYDFLVLPNFKNLGWVNADFPSLMDIKAVAVMKME